MGVLIGTDTLQKDSLWCRPALGIIFENGLQVLECFLELIVIEMDLGSAEQERGNELLGRQESNGAVVLLAPTVQGHQGGCPVYLKLLRERLVVMWKSQRDEVFGDKINNF